MGVDWVKPAPGRRKGRRRHSFKYTHSLTAELFSRPAAKGAHRSKAKSLPNARFEVLLTAVSRGVGDAAFGPDFRPAGCRGCPSGLCCCSYLAYLVGREDALSCVVLVAHGLCRSGAWPCGRRRSALGHAWFRIRCGGLLHGYELGALVVIERTMF
jgi:hypothetical protein